MKTVKIEGDKETSILYKAVIDTGTSFLGMKDDFKIALKNK